MNKSEKFKSWLKHIKTYHPTSFILINYGLGTTLVVGIILTTVGILAAPFYLFGMEWGILWIVALMLIGAAMDGVDTE